MGGHFGTYFGNRFGCRGSFWAYAGGPFWAYAGGRFWASVGGHFGFMLGVILGLRLQYGHDMFDGCALIVILAHYFNIGSIGRDVTTSRKEN